MAPTGDESILDHAGALDEIACKFYGWSYNGRVMSIQDPAPAPRAALVGIAAESVGPEIRHGDSAPTEEWVAPWKPLGLALAEHHRGIQGGLALVRMEDGACLPLPPSIFFRAPDELPELEILALELCRGSVLDIGAGAGCHSLPLQLRGHAVTALDISPRAVEVMRRRGVRVTRQGDFFELIPEPWDTLLLLMNGLGFVGDLEGLDRFFSRTAELLADGGQILCDSCDLARIADPEEERRGRKRQASGRHRGETRQQIEYGGWVGRPFGWLYLAAEDLGQIALRHGFHSQVVFEDGEGNYLARLVRG